MAGNWLGFFATGADQIEISDKGEIDRLYGRHRLRVMLAITLGYGLIYTCRLALGVVKKPIIDAGIFTPNELGLIGSTLFYLAAAAGLLGLDLEAVLTKEHARVATLGVFHLT